MKYIISILLIMHLALPTFGAEYTAPEVPYEAQDFMPESNDFLEGLTAMLKKVLLKLRPDLAEANGVFLGLVGISVIFGLLGAVSGFISFPMELCGAASTASVLLLSTNSLIRLGTNTITQLTEYGKLLLPVMTAALAAQGGVTTSGALYAGSTLFISLLSHLIAKILIPGIYLYLVFSIGAAATAQKSLLGFRDMLKSGISWCLKIILTIFTSYISITGIVSGATDAAALKATKVTISSFVPVVGGILSDASEAVLISVSLAKNAAGIYGIFAILAVFLHPFLKIGMHYLVLKASCAVCSLLGPKSITDLIQDFSTAMGILLAMTGAICLMLLISTVCFLRGVGA